LRFLSLVLIIIGFLNPSIGFSGTETSKSPLIKFKPIKAKKHINQKVLNIVITNYYQQSHRASSVKPSVAVIEISELYKRKSKMELPLVTRVELAQSIKKYQANEGKQVGFQNIRKLASVLPPKKTVSNINFEEELE